VTVLYTFFYYAVVSLDHRIFFQLIYSDEGSGLNSLSYKEDEYLSKSYYTYMCLKASTFHKELKEKILSQLNEVEV